MQLAFKVHPFHFLGFLFSDSVLPPFLYTLQNSENQLKTHEITQIRSFEEANNIFS